MTQDLSEIGREAAPLQEVHDVVLSRSVNGREGLIAACEMLGHAKNASSAAGKLR